MSSRHYSGHGHSAQHAGRNRSNYHVSYTYGSAAPVLRPEDERRAARDAANRRGHSQAARPAARRVNRTDSARIAAMMMAICVMCVGLFYYIGLQSRVTNAVEEISSLESELSDLRSDNDEALNAINSSVSLDDIKYRAIADLGMTYAQEDQIITYSNDDTDYVRQVIQP